MDADGHPMWVTVEARFPGRLLTSSIGAVMSVPSLVGVEVELPGPRGPHVSGLVGARLIAPALAAAGRTDPE
jgi:hypothetical protein